jgi:hypothetical protein
VLLLSGFKVHDFTPSITGANADRQAALFQSPALV